MSNAPQQSVIQTKDHVLFLSTVFCFWFATYIYVPTFSLYLEYKHFSYSAIGMILGSYGVTQVLLRFPLGILSDILQHIRKQLYIAGFAVAMISGIILVYFDSFAAILAARLLAGITASMWVMATILYAQYFVRSHSSRAMGTLQFLTVMPQFASMALAALIVQSFGWTLPFWIAVVASFVGFILACFIKVIPQTRPEGQVRIKQYISQTIRVPSLRSITVLSMIGHAILFITIFGFTPLYAASIGITDGSLVWLVIAFFIPHAAASLGLAFVKLRDAYIDRILLISFIGTGIAMFAVPFTNSLISLSIVHAVIGLTLGLLLPLLLGKIAGLPVDSLRTSVMGFYQSFYALGIFLGPLLAGSIAEWFGLTEMFWFGGILALIGLPFLFVIRKRIA
ncbi:MFS transporter [Alkalicoccobacillus murimartini]|uniref:MFS family arabinose efflux permease n=1 Tax=Alkalicoccobacillus murimartini TaxID=171685 RepID=A0ABT9YJF5_9BACI|nr:MFS transporter [Alkalicoccobacillus murimartini]MDQ0207164.1 putative MFS family arabinose efflux permease [Alkalicoccobacillus murimartini]